jgi:hypothetical protein
VLLDPDDSRMRPRLGGRLGRAPGQQLQLAIRTANELLNNGTGKDALAFAGLIDDVAERGELGWQRRSDQRVEPQFMRASNGCRRAC